jgi:two-component system chemotaxis sensor kinase CheA
MEIDLEKILKIYTEEAEDHLAAMEEALLGLETEPSDDKLLDAIFRGAHTIKGNSASLGFPELARFAHGSEELLHRLRSHQIPVTRAAVTLLLRAVDAMRQLVPAAVAGRDQLAPEHIDLLAALADGAPGAQDGEPGVMPMPDRGSKRPLGSLRAETQSSMQKTGTVRVKTHKLDRMLNIAGEIAIAQSRLSDVLGPLGADGAAAEEAHAQLQRLTLEMQEEIMQLRMQPLGPIFRTYLRAVRDMAGAHGKLARLELHGEEVEVDVSVVNHLKDPLMHMIRNAIDHGIESPEKRHACGKDPCGCLTLRASHEGGEIVIQLLDDGAGLDRRRIIEQARRMEIRAEPEKLADAELFHLIFTPGFTTAEEVTDLSGRGIGMDVVRQNIEALRGSVAIDSEPGMGTAMTIRLPLTMAIIEGFSVGVGSETFILPLCKVVECVQMPPGASHGERGEGVIDLRGQALPYVRLRDWFQLPSLKPPREHIVVVEADRTRAGLAVDALYGPRHTVIKPLAKQLQGVQGIDGSAILGNGRVALILDPADLLRSVIRSTGKTPMPRRDSGAPWQRSRDSGAAPNC